ncbi:MAG: TlyA family RNA methyltransferase [Clostridiales bacterium]|nr:TlyA family RNA methyltransferase [Clostridiales bacterium]
MRADKFFAEKYGSRTKAAQALERGLILRGDKHLSPADEVQESDVFTFIETSDFVSNGGKKLEKGLSHFQIDVTGKVFADLGASTGGFTDCLLRRGARRVYCVDVGTSQLDRAIAEHQSVVVMDDTNARYLKKSDFPEKLDGVVSDLSFISLKLVLPAVCDILEESGVALVLFKQQLECVWKNLNKRGILPTAYNKTLHEHF